MNQRFICCLLNVSSGRSFGVIEDIASAATTVPRSAVLNVFADRDYNRSVVTIVADGSTIVPAVLAAAKRAFERISLKDHKGGHPRLGAVDLMPFYPLGSNVSLEYCGEKAKELARRLTDEVPGASVFFFGHADGERRSLVTRRKEFRWYSNDPKVKPDIGELTSEGGVTGVGASPYVTNFNITLDTQDVKVGEEVARLIRATSPEGVPGVESMAFPHQGRVEVALNVNGRPREEFPPTVEPVEGFGEVWYASPDYLEQRVRQLAAAHDVVIFGLRTIGFWPKEAAELTKATIDVDPQVWLKRWHMKQM